VAAARHPFYGERIRVEHWTNALEQEPAAARNMLGRADPYTRLPYFFSDQYDTGMEYAGLARTWDRVVFRGDPASREFIAFWLTGDRVVAGMNFNVWDVTDAIQRLILSRTAVDDRHLTDPDVPLETLAPEAEGRLSCSSRSRSTTPAAPPTCYGRPTRPATAAMASCRSNALPTSPVASFFVSRVDSKVDARLPARSGLRGRWRSPTLTVPTGAIAPASPTSAGAR
jgi:hypothetical protein